MVADQRYAHAQPSSRGRNRLSERGLGIFQVIKDTPAALMEQATLFRQSQAPRRALEQADAELLFKRGYGLADSGCGKAESTAGGDETSKIRRSDECREATQRLVHIQIHSSGFFLYMRNKP